MQETVVVAGAAAVVLSIPRRSTIFDCTHIYYVTHKPEAGVRVRGRAQCTKPTHQHTGGTPFFRTLHTTDTRIRNGRPTLTYVLLRTAGPPSVQYSCGNSYCRNCLTYVMNELTCAHTLRKRKRERACVRVSVISQYGGHGVNVPRVLLSFRLKLTQFVGIFVYCAVGALRHNYTHAQTYCKTTLLRSPSVRT